MADTSLSHALEMATLSSQRLVVTLECSKRVTEDGQDKKIQIINNVSRH